MASVYFDVFTFLVEDKRGTTIALQENKALFITLWLEHHILTTKQSCAPPQSNGATVHAYIFLMFCFVDSTLFVVV